MTQPRVTCPIVACSRDVAVSTAGRICHHKLGGTRCPGAGTLVRSASVPEPEPNPLDWIARDAERKARAAWEFVMQEPLPDHVPRGIRALVLQGADAVTIVGGITIAATRRGLEREQVWTYAVGVVRNALLSTVDDL